MFNLKTCLVRVGIGIWDSMTCCREIGFTIVGCLSILSLTLSAGTLWNLKILANIGGVLATK